ncbi:MAG TPA: sulfite exporter TauE/SafE family protein, partial [Cyclobacteriaceae bacterium]|nr:sulfite exporter TauE/SafE family protein [Cyclobacteriaceae bacterium]
SFSLFLLMNPNFSLAPTLKNSIAGGGLAGLMAGFVGTGGAIRGLVLASFNFEKNMFVGTSAAIDMGVDLSRTIIYLESNYLAWSMWIYVPLLLLASFLGSWLGKQLLQVMSQDLFRKILLGFILMMGVTLIYQNLRSP